MKPDVDTVASSELAESAVVESCALLIGEGQALSVFANRDQVKKNDTMKPH